MIVTEPLAVEVSVAAYVPFPKLVVPVIEPTSVLEITTALPDVTGQSVETAVGAVQKTGASYVLVGVKQGDVPANTVVDQQPAAGAAIGAGDTVTIFFRR